MTDTQVSVEELAQRIADRGREALIMRLRTAYDDAAAAHADLISLDRERIESLVQSAADRADGLQWRRALGGVAAEELGVSLTEALSHPAVARAQALVGAPSYEQSLAELIARPVPPASDARSNGAPAAATPAAGTPVPAPPVPEPPFPEPEPEPEPEPPAPEPVPAHGEAAEAEAEAEAAEAEAAEAEAAEAEAEAASAPAPEPAPALDEPTPAEDPAPTAEHPAPVEHDPAAVDELETVEADDVVLELLPEPDPIEYETQAYELPPAHPDEQAPLPFAPEPAGAEPAGAEPTGAGLAGTESAAEDRQLQFPAIHLGGVANLPTKRDGLGVRLSQDGLDILQGEDDIIGRLIWDEIEALEIPNLRPRRRQKQLRARLVVRTPHGDASFDVPEISADELRDRVEPLLLRYRRN